VTYVCTEITAKSRVAAPQRGAILGVRGSPRRVSARKRLARQSIKPSEKPEIADFLRCANRLGIEIAETSEGHHLCAEVYRLQKGGNRYS